MPCGPAAVSPLLDALDAPAPVGLSDLGGEWDQRVRAAVRSVLADRGESQRIKAALGRDQAWAWAGWVEGACSLAVRSRDGELLREALSSLVLLDRQLDRRDLLLVATLARRAAAKIGLAWEEMAEISPGDRSFPLPRWVLSASEELPSTHVECGAGASFEFRWATEDFDPAALERLLGGH